MKRALLLALGLAACGRQYDFSGPAPAGALECALAHGESAGYVLVEGDVDEGFLRLVQPLLPPPGERSAARPPTAPDDVTREPSTVPVRNELLVEESDGRLNVTVLTSDDSAAGERPGSSAQDQARNVIVLCTSSPPVMP